MVEQQYPDRFGWSKEIEQLLRNPDEPGHRAVAGAEEPLRQIADVLRDDSIEIPDAALGDLQTLLTDRDASPLFGDDLQAARAAADDLAERVARWA